MTNHAGLNFRELIDQYCDCTEELSGQYLLEPDDVQAVIWHIWQTQPLTLSTLIANNGHHRVHCALWQLREGELNVE